MHLTKIVLFSNFRTLWVVLWCPFEDFSVKDFRSQSFAMPSQRGRIDDNPRIFSLLFNGIERRNGTINIIFTIQTIHSADHTCENLLRDLYLFILKFNGRRRSFVQRATAAAGWESLLLSAERAESKGWELLWLLLYICFVYIYFWQFVFRHSPPLELFSFETRSSSFNFPRHLKIELFYLNEFWRPWEQFFMESSPPSMPASCNANQTKPSSKLPTLLTILFWRHRAIFFIWLNHGKIVVKGQEIGSIYLVI